MQDPAVTAPANPAPLALAAQGSFAVGGTVVHGADGQTRHGDHAYVSYQIPVGARRHPLVMLHGNGQSARTWETTPDGRDGFREIFLRRGFPVYLLDAPRRGRAGQGTIDGTIPATPQDQLWFDRFRVGIWPDRFPGVRFVSDAETLNQYFRQMTPDTAPWDLQVSASAVAALHDRIGRSVLVTHSQGGGVGWFSAMRSRNVAGIVAYEPGSNFPFPEGEVPEPLVGTAGVFGATGVPRDAFMKLTRLPVVIYYGDNIPASRSPSEGHDQWRVRLMMARSWVEAVNRHSGDAELVVLPEIGVAGNTHFPFSDLNNIEIADLMQDFLTRKGLAR